MNGKSESRREDSGSRMTVVEIVQSQVTRPTRFPVNKPKGSEIDMRYSSDFYSSSDQRPRNRGPDDKVGCEHQINQA